MRCFVTLRTKPEYRHDSFMRGAERVGFEVISTNYNRPPGNLTKGDVVVIWNGRGRDGESKMLADSRGASVLVAENGYWGQDKYGRKRYALARNWHHGMGVFPVGSPERWRLMGRPLDPWRRSGSHILVTAQRGIGPPQLKSPPGWAEDVARRLPQFTDRPVRIRPHPGRHAPVRSLEADLEDCWALVTWNSNAATEALIRGVPVFYEGPSIITAGAAEKGIDNIERPSYPDRAPAFARLAWAQWEVEEIESGEPFRRLLGL